ncbi:MAG TPA: hypothetical protein DEQ09_09225 [Bacteroidales bacterium]|nr:hypothetical protein [Bacteroidales bacterium]
MKGTLSFILFFSFVTISMAQKGIPYISYYDDNVDIEVENWAICQDKDNVMLFANRQGLLSYDGSQWDIVHLPYMPVSLYRCPANNRIYVGADNNYGYIKKNRDGSYNYVSVSGDTVNAGLITDILLTDSTVIYFSEKCISLHNLDDLSDYKRWYSKQGSPFTGMIAHRGKLFFNVKDKGLYRIESDTLFPIVTGYMTANREILFSLPFSKDKKLIGTSDNKLQLFDRIKYYEYDISNPEYLEENILSDAVLIADSLIALSTLYGGVMVLDKETGDEVTLLNYQNGLPDDEIYAINSDNNNGLWITHGYGISRVDFNLPISSFSNYTGLQGVITSVLYHNNKLYAGTNEGLFFLDEVREYDSKEILYRTPPSTKEQEDKKEVSKRPVRDFFNRLFRKKQEPETKGTIEEEKPLSQSVLAEPQYDRKTVSVLKSINYVYRKIDEIDTKVKQLMSAGNGILALSSSGLHYIEESTVIILSSSRTINSVSKLDENDFLLCTNNGLSVLSLSEGSWKANYPVQGINEPVYNVVLVDHSTWWIGSLNKVFRLEGSWETMDFEIHDYPLPDKYPVSYNMAESNDNIFAFAETGIFIYSALSDSFRLYENHELGIKPGRKHKYLLSNLNYPLVRTDEGWKSLNVQIEGLAKIESILRLIDEPVYISIDESGPIWITDNDNNIYRISDYRNRDIDTEFRMFISDVRSSEKSFYELDNMVFDPDEKAISVNISAPYYLKKTSNKYQYLIEGIMNNWSEWNNNPRINIFLESGYYTVHFRAMNILGEISEEKTISFSIKPPFSKSAFFYVIIGLIVVVLFFLILFFREKKLKHDKRILEEKVRQRTIEIEQKKEQIENQRDEIMHQKEEITSSIAYASRIQTAMLSSRQLFKNNFRDYFILFKPRDIVSGDFYWIEGNKDRIYFTAADCTGHGVPGAFMSMLGISLLNEITSDGEKDLKPFEILELLRSKVITSLSHTKSHSKAADGMDLAFCKYDKKKKVLEYAGAFNSLYHFRKGNLTVYKADRMPVGSYIPRVGNFTNNEINIEPDDIIYIFSDGYTDQFGGPEDKKFSTRQFKSTLSDLVDLPMRKQNNILEEVFKKWKGKNSQLDDVLLIGIKF